MRAFDAAEAEILQAQALVPRELCRQPRLLLSCTTSTYDGLRAGLGLGRLAKLANFANICKFLAGSFSAVSKRTFASKYAFDSIFQALQDVHIFTPLQTHYFSKKSVQKAAIFVKFQYTFADVAKIIKNL